jgi:Domain of unknown function (DUF4149)
MCNSLSIEFLLGRIFRDLCHNQRIHTNATMRRAAWGVVLCGLGMPFADCLHLLAAVTGRNRWSQPLKSDSYTARSLLSVGQLRASVSSSSGSAMSSNEDGSAKIEPWITPRLHNTAAFRSLALLGAIAAAGWSNQSPLALLSAQARAALHLFSFATWFGTMVYTTFVLGITMFKNLPRQTFGKLQAKLFPMYFALSSVTIVLQVRAFQLYALSSFENESD